jgi:hypothetical protein
MNGGGSKTTTQSNSEPWKAAQPALKQGIGAAQNLYNSGVGSQVYTDSTVVPWDAKTLQGQNAITNSANANLGGNGLSGQLQGVINSGGYNSAQLDALGNTRNLANSSWAVSPELQKIIDQTNSDANTNVSLNTSGAGRYGSGFGNAAVADAISKNTNNLLYNDLNSFNSRRDAANSNLFNMGQTGFGNLGTAYSGMQAPAQDLMKVGGMNEDLATRQLNDKLRVFNEQQNRPWENLARFQALASGAGQLGSSTTQSQPGQNPWLTGLGYASTGAGLLGGFL